MSFLKWDSVKIRRHLGAVSGCYDKELKQSGFDPQKMRERFYDFFHRKYEKITPTSEMNEALYESNVIQKCKDYLVFDLSKSCIEYVDGFTEDYKHDYYFLIGEKNDGNFITCEIDYSIITGYIYNPELIGGSWSVSKVQDANFVDITKDYHKMIIDICEKWEYERILKCI